MKRVIDYFINLYKTNEKFRSLVQAIEGAIIASFITATSDGFDFSKTGLKSLLAAVVTGVGVALRNYFKNRVSQLETK